MDEDQDAKLGQFLDRQTAVRASRTCLRCQKAPVQVLMSLCATCAQATIQRWALSLNKTEDE